MTLPQSDFNIQIFLHVLNIAEFGLFHFQNFLIFIDLLRLNNELIKIIFKGRQLP